MRPAHGIRFLLAVLCWFGPNPSGEASEEAAWAAEILKVAGRNQGLCLILGAGQGQAPGLAAELAARSGLLVHGISHDEAALERARSAVEGKAVTGQARIERSTLAPLPLASDLVDLLVVEDPAGMAARGLTAAEGLRVLAPGGLLLERRDGQWLATEKPRPAGMDEWTHVRYDAGDNLVSRDRVLRFPLALRWIDGLPKNTNKWASVRGWVAAGGRVFTVGASEFENLGPPRRNDHYLVARNAFNGLPLWKLNLQTQDNGAGLFFLNAAPLAADSRCVYAALKDKAVAVEAASGRVARTFQTRHPPARLLLAQGLLVSVNWEGREDFRSPHVDGGLWSTWAGKGEQGSVEAFDTQTGEAKWSIPLPAQTALAAGETVYVLAQAGNPARRQELIAVQGRSGAERWRLGHEKFGPEADLQLSVACPGFVVVTRRRSGSLAVLAEGDGRVLWEDRVEFSPGARIGQTPWIWTPVVDGMLWHKGKRRDPLTGEEKGAAPLHTLQQGCTPSVVVGNLITQSRQCTYLEFLPQGERFKTRSFVFPAARGGCIEGMVPANGLFYTAQNNCLCAPGQILGFLAFGPAGEEAGGDEFARPRPVEPGPALGKVAPPAGPEPAGWPTWLGDAQRSGAGKGALPGRLRIVWRTPLAGTSRGPLAPAWEARLAPPLTAPVIGQDLVVAGATEEGWLAACDPRSGRVVWKAQLGGRIDSPPTLWQGYCVAGCRDGWIYALRLSDGRLAWRTRAAPRERRLVAHGQLESAWPATGSLAQAGGILFASAGRASECDGGVALLALEPATGRTLWSRGIAPGPQARNAVPAVAGGRLLWNGRGFDPRTGEPAGEKDAPEPDTLLESHLAGYGFRMGFGPLRAWNEKLLVQAGKVCSAHPRPASPEARAAESARGASLPLLWQAALASEPNSLALGSDRLVVAGAASEAGGWLWLLRLEDGQRLGEIPLPASPVPHGLAVAGGQVYVSLRNGELCALGAAEGAQE